MNKEQFTILLGKHMTKKGFTTPWLHRQSSVPIPTLKRWLGGKGTPRYWRPLVEVASALNLTQSETDQLLIAAGHLTVSQLKKEATSVEEVALLGRWQGAFLVPSTVDGMVGRSTLVADITKVLTRPESPRICMVQGMGGVGKTTVALTVAHAVRDQFVDGILWANLHETTDDHHLDILRRFARAIALTVVGSLTIDELSYAIKSALADKQVLIVLDDVQTGKQIDLFRPIGTEGALLLTARPRSIRTPLGTTRIELMSFDTTDDTLALFRQQLGDERVTQELAAFTDIAMLIGNLPLAATIVAQRLRLDDDWSAAEFLEEALRPEHSRLTALEHDDLNVRLSFNVTYQQLPPVKQNYFAALGVFGGKPFSIPAAAHVLTISPNSAKSLLRDLHHRALLEQVGTKEEPRYQLHALLSQFAHDFLSGRESYGRKIDFFITYAIENWTNERALYAEIENLRTAFHEARQYNIDLPFIKGVLATYPFFFDHGSHDTISDHLTAALTLAHNRNEPHHAAQLMAALAHIATRQNRWDEAKRWLNEAEATSNDDVTRVKCGRVRALITRHSNIHNAIPIYESTLAFARATNQPSYDIAGLSYDLAALYTHTGKQDATKPLITTCLEWAAGNDDRLHSLTLELKGSIARNQGEYRIAQEAFTEALRIAKTVNNPRDLLLLYMRDGTLARFQGRYKVALDSYEKASVIANAIAYPSHQISLCENMSELFIEQGQFAKAQQQLDQGFALSKQHNNDFFLAFLYLQQGLWHIRKQQDWERGRSYIAQSITYAHETNDSQQIVHAQLAMGDVLIHLNEPALAQAAFEEALQLAGEGNFVAEKILARYGIGRITNNISQVEECYITLKQMGHYRAKSLKVWLRKNC